MPFTATSISITISAKKTRITPTMPNLTIKYINTKSESISGTESEPLGVPKKEPANNVSSALLI